MEGLLIDKLKEMSRVNTQSKLDRKYYMLKLKTWNFLKRKRKS